MDLISILTNAANGLGAFQVHTATAAHNIANADTPGYARQHAVLVESTPSELVGSRGWIGGGVQVQGVYQTRDLFVETQLPRAYSLSSKSTAESDALSVVSALNPDASGNLTDAIGNFYTSLRSLAQNPGDVGLRRAVIDTATLLAGTFNHTASSIDDARTGVDGDLRGIVDEANATANSIAELNKRISVIIPTGVTPNDLLDQRQALMDKLSQLTGAMPVPDNHGNMSMSMPGGIMLVSGPTSTTLSLRSNPGNQGHQDVCFDPIDGSPPYPLTMGELGGQIAGLMSARDHALGQAAGQLDQMAFDFANVINAQHEAGFALDGSQGGALFNVPGTSTGAALVISVSDAIKNNLSLFAAASQPTAVPGDSSNLEAIINTEKTPLSGNLSAQDTLAKIVSDFGVGTQTAANAAAFDKAMLDHLENSRDSSSGVSMDDELVDLTRFQRAYEALSKVITTSDQMLQVLISMKQ